MEQPKQMAIQDTIKFLMASGAEQNVIAAKKLQASLDAAGIKVPMTNPETEEWLRKFITEDIEMLKLKDQVRLLASEDDCVLIQGETGTGKDIIAHALHGHRKGKFLDINVTSLPDYLIESELFGHVKGSFTGADRDKVGLLKEAWNGTVFMDEIGDMPFHLQAKLLKVIETKKIRPVGSNEYQDITCRFIFATHQDIGNDTKKFRQDLFARIQTFTLVTKPLRNRPQDIPSIIKSLDSSFPEGKIKEIENNYGGGNYLLPLNVRNLQSMVRRWKVFGEV